MSTNNQQMREFIKDLENNGVSLLRFLNVYCGICNEFISKNKMSHNDVKYFLPELKRIGFEDAYKNKDKILKGEIIPVIDSFGSVAPYEKPIVNSFDEIIIFDEEEEALTKEVSDEELRSAIEEYLRVNELSAFELNRLAKIFKQEKMMKEYRTIINIIKKNKKEKNKYKEKKRKLERRDVYEY